MLIRWFMTGFWVNLVDAEVLSMCALVWSLRGALDQLVHY